MTGYVRIGNEHPPQLVTELWAWIATEENGGEGLAACGMTLHGEPYFMPLIGADEERIRALEPQAMHVAAVTGRPVTLKRFKLVEA